MKKIIILFLILACVSCNKTYYIENTIGDIKVYQNDTISIYKDVLISENILKFAHGKLIHKYTTFNAIKENHIEFHTDDGYYIIINNKIPYSIKAIKKISEDNSRAK